MWTVIRYRWLQALVVACLAALVTACAVFAPLYDRAIQQATVATRLAETRAEVSGLTINSLGSSEANALDLGSLARLAPRTVRPYLRGPVSSITVSTLRLPADDPSGPTGPLMWRQGMCRHVRFVAGHCPTAVETVAVSAADARNFGWRVGSRFRLTEVVIDPTYSQRVTRENSPRMTVVGVYSARRGPYWFGGAPVGRSGTQEGKGRPQVDGWLTSRQTVDGATWVDPLYEVDFPLDKAAVGIDEILRIGPAVARFLTLPYHPADDAYSSYSPPRVDAYSGLPDIAEAATKGRDQARFTVPLLMVQLGLLAVVVLWLVLGAVTEQRRPEVAVARLRGRGVGGARRLLLGELGAVVAAGVPVGVGMALGLSWLARHAFLPLTPAFELGWGFVVALVTVVVVLTVPTLAAAQRVAREPVSALLRRVPARRTSWAVGVVDAMVMACCATAVVAFATGGLHGPLALAAPSLLALLVGLVLAHLLVPVTAAAGHRLLARGRPAAGVSALHVSRRPATRRVVAIVTVATALLVFSADALAVGARNREYAADQQVGAPLVATVDGQDVAGVRAALQAVDPAGRAVTTVVRLDPPGLAGTSTQAVDPHQFSRIALLPGLSATSIPWHRLRPPAVPPLRLVGRSVSLSVTSHVEPGDSLSDSEHAAVSLGLRVVGPDRQAQVVTATVLAARGRGSDVSRRVRVRIPCAAGCDLAGLQLDTEQAKAVRGRFEVAGLVTSGGRPLAVGPGDHWLRTPTQAVGFMHPLRGPRGNSTALRVRFSSTGAGPVIMNHASIPARLPALVSGVLPPGSGTHRFAGLDLDGVNRPMLRVAGLPWVPGAPANTALVNLDVLQRGGAVLDPTGTVQVWFHRDDPALLARVTRSLHARGLSVTTTSSVATARRALDRSAAAWSLDLAMLVGLAGLLVAALVLVVVAATTWRLRSRDFAALRMSGLSRSQISLVAAGEQVPVVALAVVVGAVCGTVGASLAMPTVPLFASAPQVSTLSLGTAWGAAVAAGVLALVVLCAVGWVAAWRLVGRADLDRVRESL